MLEFMRKAAAGWVAKFFIAMLVLSFGIWGINDIFRGYRGDTVVQVGGTSVNSAAFQRMLNLEMTMYSRRAGRNVTMDEARAANLPGRVAARAIAEATLDEVTKSMKLGVTDKEVANQIANDPSFQSPTGGFDRNYFKQILRTNGYSEDAYVSERKALALRLQVAAGLSGGATAPNAMLEMFQRYESETREVDYATLTAASLGEIDAPSDSDLETFYEGKKIAFRAPEYRAFQIVSLTAAAIAKPDQVTEADARAAYESQLQKFTTAERRKLLQILYTSKEDAEAAASRIAAGESFETLMAERSLSEADVDLGLVTKGELIDPAVADAAFALEAGATSGAVEGRFGSVILKVVSVEPEAVTPFEEVAQTIRNDIALSQAEAEMFDLHDAIEDARAGGASFAEIADKFHLPLRQIAPISRDGATPAGTKVTDLPEADTLVGNVFESDIGVENDPIQSGTTGFVWFDVTEVVPARDRTLDEVRDEVVKQWLDDRARGLIAEKATEMVAKVNGGATFADVAAEAGLTVASSEAFTRLEPKPPLTAEAIENAFAGGSGHAGSAHGENGIDRIVFVVTKVNVPVFFPEAADVARAKEQLDRFFGDALVEQYVSGLQQRLGVRINQNLIAQIAGK